LAVLPFQTATDTPRARIDFPLPSALTDAATMRVRGAASDPDGVAAVRVNGVSASTVDGFAHWWAVVPLELGENELVVETVDGAGNLDRSAARTIVHRDGALLVKPVAMALDGRDRAWVVDHVATFQSFLATPRVLGARLDLGQVSVVSSHEVGNGPLWPTKVGFQGIVVAGELEWEEARQRLLLLDPTRGDLLAIDPDSGDRTVLSSSKDGLGASLDGAWGMEIDSLLDCAWVLRVLDSIPPMELRAVIRVDLATGARTLVQTMSSSAVVPGKRVARIPGGDLLMYGTGSQVRGFPVGGGIEKILLTPGAGEPGYQSHIRDLVPTSRERAWLCTAKEPTAVGALDSQVYVADFDSDTLTVIPSPELGRKCYLEDLSLDVVRQRLLAVDSGNASILGFEAAGGPAVVALSSTIGSGEGFAYGDGRAIEYDGTGLILWLDAEGQSLSSIDLCDGSRHLVSAVAVLGSGPPLREATGIAMDRSVEPPRAIVCDRVRESLLAIDLESGNRTVVSGEGVGAGPSFQADGWLGVGGDFHIEAHGGIAWVLDQGGGLMSYRLLRVDLATGDRSVASGAGVGLGPPLQRYASMALDPAGQRALLAQLEPHAVIEVDLTTGDRRELSGPGNGTGPAFPSYPQGIEWDAVGQRALWTSYDGKVLGVDGQTGDRELLAGLDPSKGPGLAITRRTTLIPSPPETEPLLVYFDAELIAVSALDPDRDPYTGQVFGQRIVLSR
jgi:hypothetical protein